MLKQLADPQLYVASAERVLSRQLRSGDQRPLVYGPAGTPLEAAAQRILSEGPRLSGMSGELDGLARQLAREVSRGNYVLSPVRRRLARLGGKTRPIYVANPLDDIVLGALAQLLAELLDGAFAPGLYSYRRGRSPHAAIAAFGSYIRAHCRQRPDPRTRGLYVVRRDVRNFGEEIDASEHSALWTQLAEALRGASLQPSAALLAWLQSALRPAVEGEGERRELERPQRGIPTGSALQPLACNLYLGPLDRLCEAVPGAFYARYGDDILFAHPDAARAELSVRAIDELIESLGLALSLDKCGAYYFTRAGRASPYPGFRGASSLDYLGVRIDFRGRLGLPRAKLRDLLGDVRQRLARSAALLDADDSDSHSPERLQTLGAVVNAALDPAHPLAHASAQPLRALVDDRAQLRDLDYKLARCLAQVLTGRGDVRAFRRYPPRQLRAQAGLSSLVRARNQALRPAP